MGTTIYFFFPFSLFVSVYVYASVCDFFCIALLLPFVLGFYLSIFLVFLFFFFFLLKKIFFLKNYFLFFISLYFIILYFILFYLLLSFFLSFLPCILSCVEDRLWVLQLSVRALPLR